MKARGIVSDKQWIVTQSPKRGWRNSQATVMMFVEARSAAEAVRKALETNTQDGFSAGKSPYSTAMKAEPLQFGKVYYT